MDKVLQYTRYRSLMITVLLSATVVSLSQKIEAFTWGWRAFAVLGVVELFRLLAAALLVHLDTGPPAKCAAGAAILLIAPLSLAVTLMSPAADGFVPIAGWAALEVVISLGLPLALWPAKNQRPSAVLNRPSPPVSIRSPVGRKARQRSATRTPTGAILAAAPRQRRPSPLPAAKRLLAAFVRDELRAQAGARLLHSCLRRRLDDYADHHQLPRPSSQALARALRALGFSRGRGPGHHIHYLDFALKRQCHRHKSV